jgi:periplasmic protein TonB
MTIVPSGGQQTPEAVKAEVSPNARFLAGAASHGSAWRVEFGHSVLASALAHIGGFLLALLIVGSTAVAPPPNDPVREQRLDVVWLHASGPGGSVGGGGDRTSTPPRQAQAPGQEKTTGGAARPPKLLPEPAKEPRAPEIPVNIPVVTTWAGPVELPGGLTGLPALPSQGSGVAGGVGTGAGPGVGGGSGPRIGAGFGDGSGNLFGPGHGVTMPAVLTEVKPNYTAEAMRAKVQGAVMVEAIVREDGSVGQVRVVRPLDRAFGLDEEALKAVRKWRFRPGKHQGQNVAVIVEIELTFTLR